MMDMFIYKYKPFWQEVSLNFPDTQDTLGPIGLFLKKNIAVLFKFYIRI